MLEDIKIVAELLGFNVKDFTTLMAKAREQRKIKRIEQLREKYTEYANYISKISLIDKYYNPSKIDTDLKQFCILISVHPEINKN